VRISLQTWQSVLDIFSLNLKPAYEPTILFEQESASLMGNCRRLRRRHRSNYIILFAGAIS